ncbi:MAG: hypothetical protein AVDCRST_MAG96-335 [uncultured Segetibacter sp.]|uniref:MobA/VirD2-like nuclease domain-containing protein n=1 Tax=uncultured Segetibacter sp. TaxID=481133 RepID=A0A6J4RC39_9BACT|nr:MAG: hypothetical protein AVDCRST_MAG96-335 [uncultured Segetibacter sp.]
MLSKVFSGHSFYHACRYIVNKPEAEVLECIGVREHNYQVMSDDFILQQQLRPEKEKACFHCSLSFHPGEKVSDEQMKQIAKEYLERLKIVNTQVAIVKHLDRRHLHMHIVANMIDNNGKVISDSFLGLRGKKTAQQLTLGHKLVPALKKDLKLTNYHALRKSEANKYKIYESILQVLPQCKTMKDLENKLQLRGIETQYKYKGQTLEKQGVSFKMGDYSFKGSQVDRQFSLGNVEKTMAVNQKEALTLRPGVAENRNRYSSATVNPSAEINYKFKEDLQENPIQKGLEKSLEIFTNA